MVILPDPLREAPTRPPLPDDEVPYLDTVFYKVIFKSLLGPFFLSSREKQQKMKPCANCNTPIKHCVHYMSVFKILYHLEEEKI